VQNSRIVALALIGIMLSSSSVSVADGYTVWLEISEIKSSHELLFSAIPQIYKINLLDATEFSMSKNTVGKPESHVINLVDGVSGSFANKVYDKGMPYQIKLFDGSAVSTINDANEPSFNNKNQKIISINLSDGVNSDISGNDADSKIVRIKQADERKALWERIFPLDRIRNGVKSFYQIIQNDHSLSYIQLDEIGSQNYDYSIKQTPIDETALERMSEFDKLVEKSLYVAEQVDIYTNNLLAVKKFVGKVGYVSDQLAIRAHSYSDPEKFIGKVGYVSAQLAIHAQDYSNPEKFIGKSKFVGQEISVQVYQIVDPNQPILLVLLLPFASFVVIRAENSVASSKFIL